MKIDMEHIKRMKDEVTKKIMDATPEFTSHSNTVTVSLTDTMLPYRDVTFDYSDKEYYWIAAYDSKKSGGMVGLCLPHKSSEYVKTWKTLNGAKRNFIKAHIRY